MTDENKTKSTWLQTLASACYQALRNSLAQFGEKGKSVIFIMLDDQNDDYTVCAVRGNPTRDQLAASIKALQHCLDQIDLEAEKGDKELH